MPNWCSNFLRISGSREDLDDFVNRNSHRDDEGRYFPILFQKGAPADRSDVDGVDAHVGTWGTKWDLDEETIEEREDSEIVYRFNTAWSPPFKWLSKVIKLHPNLTAELYYLETGMRFAGCLLYADGNATETEENLDDPEVADFYSDLFGCYIDCEECDSTGKIDGIGGRKIDCNTCGGDGRVRGV